MLSLLLATILFTAKLSDPKTGQTVLEPMFAAKLECLQLSGPVAMKGEAMQCELKNEKDKPSELHCKNGGVYRVEHFTLQVSR